MILLTVFVKNLNIQSEKYVRDIIIKDELETLYKNSKIPETYKKLIFDSLQKNQGARPSIATWQGIFNMRNSQAHLASIMKRIEK